MTKHWFAAGILLAALGGCGGGGTGGGSVVTPTPSPTPTPAPTPSPSPTPSYPRFAELTGSQTFQTACASLETNAAPPVPQPATAFGSGFTLAYNAGAETYLLTGDGQSLSYGPAQRDAAAPAGVTSYVRTADGFTQRLTLGVPVAGGVALDYTRGLTLRALRQGQPAQYQCVYGVPTLASDLPAGSVVYARANLNGVIYTAANGGGQQAYSTEASVVTLTLDPTTSRVSFTLQLLGTLQTATGPAPTPTALGTYTGTGTINAARTSYTGTLASSDRTVQLGTFGGWLFGPQAREAGMTMSLLAVDTTSGVRISVLGNIVASR